MTVEKSSILTAVEKHRKESSRIAKHEGDDKYSWALFINGRPAYNGMSKSEAEWRRKEYVKKGKL